MSEVERLRKALSVSVWTEEEMTVLKDAYERGRAHRGYSELLMGIAAAILRYRACQAVGAEGAAEIQALYGLEAELARREAKQEAA